MDFILRGEEGREVRARVRREGPVYVVDLEEAGKRRSIRIDAAGRSLIIDGRQHEVSVSPVPGEDGVYLVSADGVSRRIEVSDPLTVLAAQSRDASAAKHGGRVTAYMPGRVVSLLVEPGASVVAGQGLVVLEAMKMQNEIQAERAGVVKAVHVQAGQSVDGGDLLFEIE